MNCQVLQTIYVRSNGDVPCAHDAGEPILLGRLGRGSSVSAMLKGERLEHVRSSLKAGQKPWPTICSNCACFRPDDRFDDQLWRRRVKKLQIEASLACNLACPACTNSQQVKDRPAPFKLPLEDADELLRNLRDEGFSIDEIEYAGQGEPLAHPEFRALVDLARDLFPDTRQRLITNGNYDYRQRVGGSALDEIYVSCDGAFQKSYEKYRIGGSVESALKFLRDAPGEIGGRKQLRIWKYILFEFNDSNEEIERAQHLAQEIGVDTLLFILTSSAYASRRWTTGNAALFPCLYPNVLVHGTAIVEHLARRDDARMLSQPRPSPLGRLTQMRGAIDSVRLSDGVVSLRGWADSALPLSRIEVCIDGDAVGEARAGFPRLDVVAALPNRRRVNCGLAFIGEVGRLSGDHQLDLRGYSGTTNLGTVGQVFRFPKPG
jgi:organic radical activating enzyme